VEINRRRATTDRRTPPLLSVVLIEAIAAVEKAGLQIDGTIDLAAMGQIDDRPEIDELGVASVGDIIHDAFLRVELRLDVARAG
jgi:hypothetical protein